MDAGKPLFHWNSLTRLILICIIYSDIGTSLLGGNYLENVILVQTQIASFMSCGMSNLFPNSDTFMERSKLAFETNPD